MAGINYRFQFKEAKEVAKWKAFKQADFEKRLAEEMAWAAIDTARDARDDLEQLVSTWNHSVTFSVGEIPRTSRSSVTIRISTNDKIFGYLNDGTAVRYATMTPDFMPKTSVGSLYSTTGRGGKWYVSRKHERDGIEARNFYGQLVTKYRAPFMIKAREAYRRAYSEMK